VRAVATEDLPEDPVERVRFFFEEQLPRVIAARRDLFNTASGVVCVMVQGVGGWTVRFGDNRAPDALSAEASLEADLVATWSADGFSRLLAGDTSDPAAIRPIHMGDARLLERLGSLMIPPARGALGARMWTG
jgi:hypothetical protein